MEMIEIYKKALNQHENLKQIIEKSMKEGNTALMHYAKLKEIYHVVGFSFSIKHGNRHEYDKSQRLSEYIGLACKEMLPAILKRAIELSNKDITKKLKACRNEAKNVLKQIENIEGGK